MSWTGYNVGAGLEGMLNNGSRAAQNEGAKGSAQITGAVKKLK